MKIQKILIFITTILISSSAIAGDKETGNRVENIFSTKADVKSTDGSKSFTRFKAGVLIGTDIGGAIPVPLKYVPETFNPYPQINIALGVFGEVNLTEYWDLGFNLTYKNVGMKADARVENQKYTDLSVNLLQYYTGTAEMDMSFIMLEIPIYARYTFKNKHSSILFGIYYAYNLKSDFSTLATNGYAGGQPDNVAIIVKPGGEPINMEFSSSLKNYDVGAMIGYEHNFMSRLDVGVRLNMGFVDIFKSGKQYEYFDYDMLHMRGSVIVRYRIFN